jgi:recombination protein RecA
MLEVFRPTDGDSALTVVESVLKFAEFRMIAIDSISGLVFTDMTEADKHTEPIGILARRMGTHTKRIMEPIFRNNAIMVLINQMRAQMNFRGQVMMVPTGGRAIKFFSSIRLSLHREEFIGPKERPIGQKLRIRVDKNSFGPPFRESFASLIYGSGFDKVRDLIDVGIETGVINQAASWMTYKDVNEKGETVEIRAHGEADLAEKLTPIIDRVRAKIHEKLATIEPPATNPKGGFVPLSKEDAEEEV